MYPNTGMGNSRYGSLPECVSPEFMAEAWLHDSISYYVEIFNRTALNYSITYIRIETKDTELGFEPNRDAFSGK